MLGIVLLSFVALGSCSLLSTLTTGTPAAPSGVSASTPTYSSTVNDGNGGYQTTISWSSDLGAVTYNVYHTYGNPANGVPDPTEVAGGGPGPSTFESNPVSTTSWVFTMGTNDPAGYVLKYAVSAVGSNGTESALSSVVTVTVP